MPARADLSRSHQRRRIGLGMHRDTIDVIREATADISFYQHRRIVVTAVLAAITLMFGYLGFTIDDPYLLGKLFRYVTGGVLFLTIANVFACTRDIRNLRRTIAAAEAGGLD
jgi:hypothetical protein